MRYRLRYTEEVKRTIPEMPGNYRQRIRREIEALAENPRPPHASLMRDDPPDRFRIKIDGWRLIYRIVEDEQTVHILRVRIKTGPETYQNLEE